ncbi:MAG: hypothetical protein WCC12_05675, partial [Anaerolineales bacterium]
EKKEEASSQVASTQPIVDLLTTILDEFRKQVQGRTPPPLEDAALTAVNAFKEISDALDVKAAPKARPAAKP